MLWEKPMRRGDEMRPRRRILTIAAGLLLALGLSGGASAQKQGGTLRVYHRDSPASMSIHEEATWSTIMPMMGVFNGSTTST
jgi:peptide/nickel transport system substrate-binding protein